MTVKSVINKGHEIKIVQHDGKTCTLYEVSYDGHALHPVSNLTVALELFDKLAEEKTDVGCN